MENEIIIFKNQNVKLEVNMKDETVWLSLDQIAKLFDRDKSVISRHIRNVFQEKELDRNRAVANFATTATDGKTYQVEYYNLDMIISIGYRVKSRNGVIFRQWANKVLKDYLIKGYAVNEKRLKSLEKTVQLINIAGKIDSPLNADEAKGIINVISSYSSALDLLDSYDHKTLSKPKGTKDAKQITYEDCMDIVGKLKYSSDSDLFALERDKGLSSIINNIYQSFDNKDVYPTIEEKAANFLYLITKNHTFIDGNKRIAATLFIYFLDFYNILYRNNKRIIDNNALVSIVLLIAGSNPKEKDILIELIMNFLQ